MFLPCSPFSKGDVRRTGGFYYKSANRSSASPSSASAAASISRILWRTSLDFSNSFAASSLLPALIFSTQISKSE
jgi:hypothetical protein